MSTYFSVRVTVYMWWFIMREPPVGAKPKFKRGRKALVQGARGVARRTSREIESR